MGYEITAYLVDEVRVGQFYGCNDEGQVVAIAERHAEHIARSDAGFASEIEQGAPTLVAAVRALAFATVDRTIDAHAFQYRYALALVCEHLGERLEETIRLNPKGIAASKELARLLAPGLLPMPISREGDFPVIGFLSRGQITRKLSGSVAAQLASGAALPTWLVWPKPLLAERATYVSWLERAAAKRLDLVGFYH